MSEFLPRSSFSVGSSESKLKFKDTIDPNTGGQADGTSKTTFSRGIQVNQNLFNSLGSTFGLKAANQIYYISKNVYYSNEQEFILKSIESYLQYLFAQEALKLAEQNLKYTLKTYQSAQERFKIGEATKSDVANASYEKSKAEIRQTADQLALIESELTQAYQRWSVLDENS